LYNREIIMSVEFYKEKHGDINEITMVAWEDLGIEY
jgi:uncharacterized protein YegP (UPF0339 family)